MQSEGIQDPIMRAALVGETLRTAPTRNEDSIWSDYDAMISAVQALYQFRTQGAVVLPTLQHAVLNSGSTDHLAAIDTDKTEDFVNWVLENYVKKFIWTCNCGLKYGEHWGYVWDPVKNEFKFKKFCYVWIVCAGTWAWCNFSLVIYFPCKYWWEDLPPCPPDREKMKKAMREGYDKGDPASIVGDTWGGDPIMISVRVPAEGVVTWCDEGHNSHHPDADVCYRQVLREEGHGQQCCYKGNNLVNAGPSASTPDKVGVAAALNSRGECINSASRAASHYTQDVWPWDLPDIIEKLFGNDVKEPWFGPNDDDPRFNVWPPSGSATEKRLLNEKSELWDPRK